MNRLYLRLNCPKSAGNVTNCIYSPVLLWQNRSFNSRSYGVLTEWFLARGANCPRKLGGGRQFFLDVNAVALTLA
jgi:hypothetical protein